MLGYMPTLQRSRRGRRLRRFFLIGVLAAIGLAAALAVAAAVALQNLPSPEDLFQRRIVQSTKIYDRSGAVLLYEIHGEERRTVIPFGEIPEAVKQATIAAEDANFYRHGGLDFKGIARALLTDIAALDFRQGGSTITQQLVKNSFLGHERTIRRKLKEALLAVSLETRLSKDEILNLYLNQIPYGSNAYGIEAAAQTFFGRHARELSGGEAALLAALPKAPSYYSPYGQHKDELLARKDRILERMAGLGSISPEEAERARAEKLRFLPATKNIRAPHFVMYVRDYLVERYGETEVEEGGLIVTTTLDWKWQEEAERLVAEGARKNEELIQAKNMALVAVDPTSGGILAMVGSRDYFDVENDGNFNVATALRQPGSAFKPFVYATAFLKGFTPETVLFDVPTEFNPLCAPGGEPRPGSGIDPQDCYHPANYDERFRGPVSVRQALAQSLNVPSVKLLYLTGIDDSIKTAEALGITTLKDRSRYGLSLVLGGAEVKLLELTSAYGVFANDGILNPPAAVMKIETASGRVLEEHRPEPRLVLDQRVARMISDVLSDNDARVPVFQPRSSLYFPDVQVAAKTGTTQDYRDAWAVGYTSAVAVGVWAGNNDNTPMRQKGSGVMAAAPIWHEYMAFALRERPSESFTPPEPAGSEKPILRGIWQGNQFATIDTVSQKLATEYTPPETKQIVAFGEPHDTLYWIDRRDPAGPPPERPGEDPQYPNWETAFSRWWAASGLAIRPLSAMPTTADDVHTPERQPRLRVETLPLENGGKGIRIRVAVETPFGIRELSLLAQDRLLISRRAPPSPIEFTLSEELIAQANPPGAIEIRAYDTVGNIGRAVLALP